jgi:parallel beta-helix repeat protein
VKRKKKMNSEKRRVKFGKQKRNALLFAILFATLALSVTVGCTSAKTITVDDDPGMADYEHIQDAVNASVPGDIIYVYEGLYIESVTVDKWGIQFIGDDRENVVIDGGWSGTCLTIKNDNTTVTNFTVQNSGSGKYGISIESADNCLVVNNTINSNGNGVELDGISYDCCENNRIINNDISSNSG